MFATLLGTDKVNQTAHRSLFNRLYAIALGRKFVAPDAAAPIQADGSLVGWTLEQMGPRVEDADFFLAVTSPRVPGISPIFPVFKTIAGPLFAVVELDAAYILSRDDQRDVVEVKDAASVARSFESFLDDLLRTAL